MEEKSTIPNTGSGLLSGIFKWFFRIMGICAVLITAAMLVLQLPAVQDAITHKVVKALNEKLNNRLQVGKLRVRFPGNLTFENILLLDQTGDTLLFGKMFTAGISLTGLLQQKIEIDQINLHQMRVKLKASPSGTYNYQYLVDAFTPTGAAVPKDTAASAPLNLGLKGVTLHEVAFEYLDSSSGIKGDFEVDYLKGNVKLVHLPKQVFTLNDLTWLGGNVQIDMFPVPPKASPDTSAAPSGLLPSFILKKAWVQEVHFAYNSPEAGMDMHADIGRYEATDLRILLTPQEIHLGNSFLYRSNYTLNLGSAIGPETTSSDGAGNVWKIFGDSIDVQQMGFAYHDREAPFLRKGLDYSHMEFSRLNLQGSNLYVYGGDTVKAHIRAGSLREKSGFVLNNIQTKLTYTANGVSLEALQLKTPSTRIKGDIGVGYPSPSAVAENPALLSLNAKLQPSVVSHKDLLLVAPMLDAYPMFAALPNASMEVQGNVSGRLDNLTLQNVYVKAFDGTKARVSGKITGLPDPLKLGTNLNIGELSMKSSDLKRMLPEGTLPDNITLPEQMNFTGTIRGAFTGLLTLDTKARTTLGNADIKGWVKYMDQPEKASYDLKGNLNGLDLGKLSGYPAYVGKVSGRFNASGNGYNPQTLQTDFDTWIQSASIAGMPIRNVGIKGKAGHGFYDIKAVSPDSTHDFNLDLYANLNGAFPEVKSYLDLRKLNLKALGLSEVPFELSAKANAEFPTLNLDAPEGFIHFRDIEGVYDTLTFNFNSITLDASRTNRGQALVFNSDFARLALTGDYALTQLFTELQQYLIRYYDFGKPQPALLGNQRAVINLVVKPSAQLKQVFPDLDMRGNVELTALFDSKACIFDLEGSLPYISVYGNTITGGTYFAKGNDTAIAYKVYLNDFYNSGFAVPTALVQGDVIANKVFTDIRLLDSIGRLQHTVSFKMEHIDSGIALHFDPESVILDYETWGLDPSNELFFIDNGMLASSFTFSNGSQALVMQTWGDSPKDPLGIRLFNFEISTFTSIARQDSLYLNGTINGFAELQLNAAYPVFNANLDIEQLQYKKDTLGNISVQVYNESKDVIAMHARMSGSDNLVEAKGSYHTGDEIFDVQLDVEKLTLETIEPFALGYINQSTGHMEGGISISGTVNQPQVLGNMLFRDAEANVPLLNSKFSLRNERIRFLKDGIHFNEFTFTDANGKKAMLDGEILTRNWLDYRFNLDFKAENFRVINSTRRDNKLFYGTLFLNSNISFRGTDKQPEISASFRANAQTDLTMVMPQMDPTLAEREGIVEFFDEDLQDSSLTFMEQLDSLNTSKVRGIALAANFEIDPKAKLSFIIDEANGDMLIAQGIANLSCALDPSGKITVTGTYELKEGSYDMSLRLFKYKFLIEPGSTITWTGEPTSADINVTALYNVKTAPYSLVEQQINGETDETKAKYRDRMPFKVKLKIRGELLKPDITFDIDIAETSGTSADVVSTVNSKLEQLRAESSQMNQQVFALILLGSFVPDNPFASSSGSNNASAFARQSVSKLLADQLNQLAGSLISGIDVDIGLESEEDYSMGSGQVRTDLNVAFSKRLLQDRLKITVGSNFELEGNARPNEKTSNIAGDVKADYTLTRDGRYVLRAYRVDQYEVALQGQVIETGVTFIISMDFDHFREIFHRKKKKADIRP